ncbi:uncharacterized protein PpBr36_11493 [Pyricularia pennisetigena]|uniref:uncharacterized protein n=1 Tax=Pyricularia pennisetigena TaxID=1578925 RepID=UPI00114E5742|nr:uncharacterized protein PpBr36_11493 [Pyricularia pennisetigena]TLS20212.1 hypothetical protein PpBr36_11493 [Pyricularia pennisetigena]
MSSTERPVTPLIIHGQDVTPSQHPEAPCFVPNQSLPGGRDTLALGATPELCVKAADSCASAFATWRNSSIQERRALFNKLAAVLRDRQDELMNLIQDELACTRTWASIGYNDTVDVVEQAAALVTSGVLSGVSPPTNNPLAHAVVFKEPLGVILGIAPWNSPLLLAFRAVVAAVATGNTAILKVSADDRQ